VVVACSLLALDSINTPLELDGSVLCCIHTDWKNISDLQKIELNVVGRSKSLPDLLSSVGHFLQWQPALPLQAVSFLPVLLRN
jgi:hypothetical protein